MTDEATKLPVAVDPDTGSGGRIVERQSVLLHTDDVVVSKRVRTTRVHAATTTSVRNELVEVDLNQDNVVVERVVIGRVVDAIPAVRQEGDVTIMPVVEEEVVVTRRLILKEEVHLRRVRTVTRHSETVALREQTIAVTRTEMDDKAPPAPGDVSSTTQ